MGPLAGIKVIEFAHIMAGPVCGLMLADMGADVIKVEKVPGGDDTRRSVPPEVAGESAAFMMMNRNKRGIAVDLKSEGGRQVAQRLIASADVVTENYRKGTMDRLGIGYEGVKQINPTVIYAELSGFGRTGPYADRAGFDLIAQGMSGLMSVTGAGPGEAPMKCGAPLTDITAGILAALGVLGAYIHRLNTGEGQRVDTSLFEAGIVHTYWQSAIAFATGVSPGPMGSAHPLSAPYQAFETADGWITIGAANQANWLVEIPRQRRVAGTAGARRRARRPRARHCRDAARPANPGTRDGARRATFENRAHADPGTPGEILVSARRDPPRRTALRRAHQGGARRARFQRRRDRRADRAGGGDRRVATRGESPK
jgi:crotonobetainyl-CoA:carnitine CoA-transferase CaiB-like acyl-CoA transferase